MLCRTIVAGASAIVLMAVLSRGADAAPPAQWRERIDRYCQTHGAQPKTISRTYQVNGAQKTVTRVFVPVLIDPSNAGAKSFVKTFLDPHSMILHARQYNQDYMHWLRVVLPPDQGETFAQENGAEVFRGRTYQQPQHDNNIQENNGPEITRFAPNGIPGNNVEGVGTRYIVVDASKESVDHTRQFFARYHKCSSTNACYGQDMVQYLAARIAEKREPGSNTAGCMWWVTNLEGKKDGAVCSLANVLGTKRTGSPSQVARLAVRAAKNEAVPVIGVAVRSLQEFAQLDEASLLLLDPHPGVEAAIRW